MSLRRRTHRYQRVWPYVERYWSWKDAISDGSYELECFEFSAPENTNFDFFSIGLEDFNDPSPNINDYVQYSPEDLGMLVEFDDQMKEYYSEYIEHA